MKDNRNDHFDQAASSWDSEATIARTAVFAEAIKKNLAGKQVANILDFGCGTGLLSEHLLDTCTKLLGIDTSLGMVEKFDLRFKNHPQVKSLVLNLEKESLPEESGPFDVIMTSMAFHHLQSPKKMLELFKSSLKSGGKIFIIDLDEEDGTFHPDNENMGVMHYGFSKDELEGWAAELEFKNFAHEIIFKIHKNDRDYGVGLATFF